MRDRLHRAEVPRARINAPCLHRAVRVRQDDQRASGRRPRGGERQDPEIVVGLARPGPVECERLVAGLAMADHQLEHTVPIKVEDRSASAVYNKQ